MACAKLKQLTKEMTWHSIHERFLWIRVFFSIHLPLDDGSSIGKVDLVFCSLTAIYRAKQHVKCLLAFAKALRNFLLRSYFGWFHGGHLHQLSSSIPSICFTYQKSFKVTLCWLTEVGKLPHGIPWAHSSNSWDSKLVTDFFHLQVYRSLTCWNGLFFLFFFVEISMGTWDTAIIHTWSFKLYISKPQVVTKF